MKSETSAILELIPKEEVDSLLRPGEFFERGKHLLESLLESQDSHKFQQRLKEMSIPPEEISSLLFIEGSHKLHPAINTLTSIMLRHPQLYAFQLGVLYSQVPLNNMTVEAQDFAEPTKFVNYPFSIKPAYNYWYLCNDAEEFILNAVEQSRTISVYDSLLVKFVGRVSAICYKTVTNGKTTFLPGLWYCPVEKSLKAQLETAYLNHETQINPLSGTWTLIRGADPKHNHLLDQVTRPSVSIPQKQIINTSSYLFL